MWTVGLSHSLQTQGGGGRASLRGGAARAEARLGNQATHSATQPPVDPVSIKREREGGGQRGREKWGTCGVVMLVCLCHKCDGYVVMCSC